jgi:hypothetical protein
MSYERYRNLAAERQGVLVSRSIAPGAEHDRRSSTASLDLRRRREGRRDEAVVLTGNGRAFSAGAISMVPEHEARGARCLVPGARKIIVGSGGRTADPCAVNDLTGLGATLALLRM